MRRCARNVRPLAQAFSCWHRRFMADSRQEKDKADRLRNALRENLRRRKQQTRDSVRAERNPEKPE